MIDRLSMFMVLAREKHFGRAAEALGITPSRSKPETPLRLAAISACMARASATMRRAHSSTRSPSWVSP